MENEIGNRIRATRIEKDITQKDLAKSCSISLSALNKYERGDRTPKFDTLEKIAKALDVQVDYLLGRSEFEKLDNQVMYNDIISLIEKTKDYDKDSTRLISDIVDTMFLTIYNLLTEKNIKSLTIVHDLYRQIYEIKNMDKKDIIRMGKKNYMQIDENFNSYKKDIDNLLTQFYKSLANKIEK